MITIMFAVIVALQLLDAATTYYSLAKLGARESNPVARFAMDKLGIVPALVLLKSAVVGVFIAFTYPLWFYAVVAALYAGVVGNNAYVIYKIKSGD